MSKHKSLELYLSDDNFEQFVSEEFEACLYNTSLDDRINYAFGSLRVAVAEYEKHLAKQRRRKRGEKLLVT